MSHNWIVTERVGPEIKNITISDDITVTDESQLDSDREGRP